MKLAKDSGIFDFSMEEYEDYVLISNMFCNFIKLKKIDFFDFVENGIYMKNEQLKEELIKKRFLYNIDDKEFIENSAKEYRRLNSYLFEGTVLHIFVLTMNCNLSCVYCQANAGKKHYDKKMTKEVAESCLQKAFETNSERIDIEFQGGEPLLNFNIIMYIIDRANVVSKQTNKEVTFSLVTNLTPITDTVAQYLYKNNVGISISLDGPEFLHDKNRPYYINNTKKSNYSDLRKGMDILNKYYCGGESKINALLTTTRDSLEHIDQIIDEYVNLGFNSIALRALSQIGEASIKWEQIGYSYSEFGDFYRAFLRKIRTKNSKFNVELKEYHADFFLKKIINKSSINHMEYRSPCGAAIGQIAYNWNGDIFTCDEGRMLSVTGDDTFKIGNVFNHSYEEVISSDKVKGIAHASSLDSLPDCFYCVYKPLCGVCPVYNYLKYGDLYCSDKEDYLCNLKKEMFRGFFDVYDDLLC